MSNPEISRRAFLGSVGATVALSHAAGGDLSAQTAPAGGGAVEKDVVYGKGGDVDLHCDVYRPSGAATKRMAIIHFHGGGFAGGNKDGLAARLGHEGGTEFDVQRVVAKFLLGDAARSAEQITFDDLAVLEIVGR